MKTLYVLPIFVAALVLAIPAHAQELQVEWQGPPGATPISGFAPLKPAEFLMDANGDGIADLVINDEATHQLIVVSGADRSTQWTYPLGFDAEVQQQAKQGGLSEEDVLVEFVEIVGDGGLKEAVVARRQGNRLIGVLEGGKVNVESGVVLFGQQYVLLGIDDYDDDGDVELYLGETEKRVVELWGPED